MKENDKSVEEVKEDALETDVIKLSDSKLKEKVERLLVRLDDEPGTVMDEAKPFIKLMTQYQCAIMEIETKLKVLDAEFSQEYKRNPFESIKSRLKSPISIAGKLRRKGLAVTVENIEKHLNDVAGIRVICSFPDDIYKLADLLAGQDDIILLGKKDYIKNPKPNGYRSLHLILDIPIFLSNEKKHMKVEVQFRTIAMDFWASLEHKLKYKKDVGNSEEIVAKLKICADSIEMLDFQMQEIRNEIDKHREWNEE